MLSRTELQDLLKLFDDSAVSLPLMKVSSLFSSLFVSDEKAFSASYSLCVMMRDELLVPVESIIALYCMAQCHHHKEKPSPDDENHTYFQPFVPFIFEVMQDIHRTNAERNFAYRLLSKQHKQVLQCHHHHQHQHHYHHRHHHHHHHRVMAIVF